jgi:hypothetical protein
MNEEVDQIIALIKTCLLSSGKIKVLLNFSTPVVDIEFLLMQFIALVRIDVFFVFVCRSVPKEGKIVIYPIKFVVSLSSLVTASDAPGRYLLSHF